jgi:4-amino-4-deoxy-L-arabinose transferase-like glycosyltransferase
LTAGATLEHATAEQPTERAALHTLDALRRPDGKPFVRGLVLITLVGAAIRVMNVLWWRPTTDRPGFHGFTLTGDAFYYHWQANALAHGEWFVDPYRWKNLGQSVASAAHPPLYTLYLSVWSRLGIDSITGHRLASSLLGVAAVAVIGLLGYRLGGTATGLVAAGIAAIYPQLWINDGVLLSESIVVLVVACALHTMYTFWRRPTLRNAIVLGLVCGVAAIGRNELLLLFPVVAIPLALLVRNLEWRPRIRLAVAACLAGAVVVAPWVLFNLTRFNEPTTTSSSLGSVLSAANCDSTYYGSTIGYYDNCFHGPWPTGDESERDLAPRHQAIEYMKDHITRLPVVVLARVGRMWGLFKPGQTTFFDWSIEGRGRAPSWIGLFAFYLLIPFAVGGLVGLRRRRITILPLLAAPVILTIAAAATFGVTRYRAPAEVSIVVAAAVGIVATARWLRSRGGAGQSAETVPGPGTLASP